MEVDWSAEGQAAAALETESAETIERITDTRFGRKGGIVQVQLFKILMLLFFVVFMYFF